MFDNKEIDEVLAKLEKIEEMDEEAAISLLKQFNSASKYLGQLLLNLDTSLKHDEWKKKCDEAQKELDLIVKKIMDF